MKCPDCEFEPMEMENRTSKEHPLAGASFPLASPGG